MACWKPNEGLFYTTKGKKKGNGGRMAHFFVAIAFNKDIVICKQYHEKLTVNSLQNLSKNIF